MKVANVSAWTKRAPDSEDAFFHGGASSGSGDKGTPDVWSSATLELQATQSRERERKLDVSQQLQAYHLHYSLSPSLSLFLRLSPSRAMVVTIPLHNVNIRRNDL